MNDSDHADRIERMNRFVKRMNAVERDLYVAQRAAEGCRHAHPGRPLRPGAEGAARQAPCAATSSCRASSCFPAAASSRPTSCMPVARPLDPHAEARLMKRLQRAERGAGARACARGDPRDVRGDRPAARRAQRRGRRQFRTAPGRAFAAGRDPARSRRAAFHRPRHHAGRAAAAVRHPLLHHRRERDRPPHRGRDRSRRRAGRAGLDADHATPSELDMPAVTGVMLEELERASPTASATICRCRSIACRAAASCGNCCDTRLRARFLTLPGERLGSAPT